MEQLHKRRLASKKAWRKKQTSHAYLDIVEKLQLTTTGARFRMLHPCPVYFQGKSSITAAQHGGAAGGFIKTKKLYDWAAVELLALIAPVRTLRKKQILDKNCKKKKTTTLFLILISKATLNIVVLIALAVFTQAHSTQLKEALSPSWLVLVFLFIWIYISLFRRLHFLFLLITSSSCSGGQHHDIVWGRRSIWRKRACKDECFVGQGCEEDKLRVTYSRSRAHRPPAAAAAGPAPTYEPGGSSAWWSSSWRHCEGVWPGPDSFSWSAGSYHPESWRWSPAFLLPSEEGQEKKMVAWCSVTHSHAEKCFLNGFHIVFSQQPQN